MSAFGPDDDESVATSPFEDEEEAAAPVSPAPAVQASGGDAANDYLALPADSLPPEQQGPAVDDWRGYQAPQEQDSGPTSASPEESAWATPIQAPPPVQFSPYRDTSPNLDALKAQYAKEATENTKPSGWRRFAAGLAGGAVTYGSRNPAAGMAVADRINNAPLANAQQRWKMAEKPLAQAVQNDQQANADIQRQNSVKQQQGVEADRQFRNQGLVQEYQARAEQYHANAQAKAAQVNQNTIRPVDPNNPFGEWQGTTNGGKIVRGLEPPSAIQKDPKFVQYQRQQDLQNWQKMGVRMSPQETKFYLANGKLAEPTEHTSINIAENPDGSARTPRSGAGSKLPSGIQELIAKNMNDKDAFAQAWQRQPDGSYLSQTGQIMSGPDFNARIDKFRTDLNANANMRKAGVMLDAQGNVGAATNDTRNAAPAQANQQPHTMAAPNPAGLVEPGNIPIDNRPTVQNPDGSHSTEYSVSFRDEQGREVLVPTVVNGRFLTPNGQKPPEGSPAEKAMFKAAWQNYVKTGQHLGKFDTPENADAYASTLHNRGSATSAQASPAQQQAPQSTKTTTGKTVKVGDQIVGPGGKKGTVAGINPQTGKIIPKWD